jgi:hypothetical protein
MMNRAGFSRLPLRPVGRRQAAGEFRDLLRQATEARRKRFGFDVRAGF